MTAATDDVSSGAVSGTAEAARLASIRKGAHWRRWGPYLSDRQWGTVREDYSPYGTAWDYFPHDHARSRAYRWGEDGIGGFGDEQLLLCLGVALWNGKDPILKERLFGLTNSEGNHGEDVKELYYYLDGTPTHSYMRMLYKYPQAAFPYAELVEENRRRGKDQPEFETDRHRRFRREPLFRCRDRICKSATRRHPDAGHGHQSRPPSRRQLHVLPQLWARNIWSWQPDSMKPRLLARGDDAISVDHPELPPMRLTCDGRPNSCSAKTKPIPDGYGGMEASGQYFKDGINDYVVDGNRDAVNPARLGTKAAAHYRLNLPAGRKRTAAAAALGRAHGVGL